MDLWLSRAASFSQPALLALAVFGYFYTVIPIYQKEVLSEQIAAKEIEAKQRQQEIDAQKIATAQLADSISSLKGTLRELERERTLIKNELAIAEERLVQQLQAVDQLRKDRTRLESRIRVSEGEMRRSGSVNLAITAFTMTVASMSLEAMQLQLKDPLPEVRLYLEKRAGELSSKTKLQDFLATIEKEASNHTKRFDWPMSREVALASVSRIRSSLEGFKGRPLSSKKHDITDTEKIIRNLLILRDQEKKRPILFDELTQSEKDGIRAYVLVVYAEQMAALSELLAPEIK